MGEVVTHYQVPLVPAQHSTDGPCETHLFPDLGTPSPLHSLIQPGKLALAVEPFFPDISIEEDVSNDAPSPWKNELCLVRGTPWQRGGGETAVSTSWVYLWPHTRSSVFPPQCALEVMVYPSRFLLNTWIFCVQAQETESWPSFLKSKPAL